MITTIVKLNTNYKYNIIPNIKNKYIFSNFIIMLKMINDQIDQSLTNERAKEVLSSSVNSEMFSSYGTLIPLMDSIELS